MNTYDWPYSVRVDVDIRNVTFREEDVNKKTSMYIYTAHLLDTPSHVPVRQMPLDLDNGLPGVVTWIEKTNNDDNISFLAHINTLPSTQTTFYCININWQNLYNLLLNLSNMMTHNILILSSFNAQSHI